MPEPTNEELLPILNKIARYFEEDDSKQGEMYIKVDAVHKAIFDDKGNNRIQMISQTLYGESGQNGMRKDVNFMRNKVPLIILVTNLVVAVATAVIVKFFTGG